ncbi:MAG: hypothetical protein HCA25_24700 [Dolichospermum sp. DET50]|nr:hypothetical protein [Dolichospermum sp. DET67]MBS3040551.1 hypothetical protein [Dolichospermum sp. DET50]QSX67687.1 MAG: hypothetical protein EZY12_23970 [Dolichospermum sp. DET69]
MLNQESVAKETTLGACCQGVSGRVVVQSATRLEIRVDGKRIGGKLTDFKKLHSKDAYSYF